MTYVQNRDALTFFYAKRVVHEDGVTTGPGGRIVEKAMHAALVSHAIMDARWKHPLTCIVAGPTGCGKSTFVTRMLRHAAAMIVPPPQQITWCYGEWQEAYATTELGHVRFEEGLTDCGPCSIRQRGTSSVIDDLMAETDERVTTLFTKKSHHRNTSVLYLVQNLFPKNKESRTISLNSQYMVVFKNPRDSSQMATLARQMYPGRGKFVQAAFKDATAGTVRLSVGRSQTGHARGHASA